MVRVGRLFKRYCPPLAVIFILLAVFVPNTKQACTIYVVPKIINNEQVQQIPDKLLELGNKQLDEWIEEFKDVKK